MLMIDCVVLEIVCNPSIFNQGFNLDQSEEKNNGAQ